MPGTAPNPVNPQQRLDMSFDAVLDLDHHGHFSTIPVPTLERRARDLQHALQPYIPVKTYVPLLYVFEAGSGGIPAGVQIAIVPTAAVAMRFTVNRVTVTWIPPGVTALYANEH